MNKVYMNEYYNISGLGLVRTIGKARDCKTQEIMIMFSTVGNNGMVKDTLLLEENAFAERIQ